MRFRDLVYTLKEARKVSSSPSRTAQTMQAVILQDAQWQC